MSTLDDETINEFTQMYDEKVKHELEEIQDQDDGYSPLMKDIMKYMMGLSV